MPHKLTKSSFIRGTQCIKSLYLNKHHRNLKDEISASQQAIFDQGSDVGVLAQQLFPNGVDCSPDSFYNVQQGVERTKHALENGETVIYEAAFEFDELLVLLDILVKTPEGWKAFEVKSSTSVSETHQIDATVQYYCITNAGIELSDISIVYINNQYTRQGPIDVHQLFTVESVHDAVQQILPNIPDALSSFKDILSQSDVPQMDIGIHCTSPYPCDFMGHCWKHIPDQSIFNIARLKGDKKFELYGQGILRYEDIPTGFLNEKQQMQVDCALNGETVINQEAISDFINRLEYPIYHLDFETINTAVPLFDGSRPYQQIPFQYSLHIEHADGTVNHHEYLSETNGGDPRTGFINQLLRDIGNQGTVLVYNESFEKGVLNNLATFFPEHADEIRGIISRIDDLMIPFRNRWYYSPDMQGSYSIKYVLPALVQDLSYADLNIQEGGTASSTFVAMLQGTFKGDVEQTRIDLLDYCKLDTLAMVRILEVLKTTVL